MVKLDIKPWDDETDLKGKDLIFLQVFDFQRRFRIFLLVSNIQR
jgi:hypothetical protein